MSTVRHLPFETAVDARLLTDVQISPDGSRVVFSTTSPSREQGRRLLGPISLVSVETGDMRLLTEEASLNHWPRWSPDGARLAFLSDRAGAGDSQIFVTDAAGVAEATCLTEDAGGVVAVEWSPDGQWLAYLALESMEQRDIAVADETPATAALWLISTRQSGEERIARRISPVGLCLSPLHGLAWAPDGAALAAVSVDSLSLGDLMTSKLVTVTTEGEVSHVSELESLGCQPRFSPDGSHIAINSATGAFPGTYFALEVVDLVGHGHQRVAADHEGAFLGFAWLSNRGRLVAIVQEGQRGRLVTLEAATGEAEDAVAEFEDPGMLGRQVSVTADGRRVAFARATSRSCGEVFVADLGERATQLTDLNPWTREFEFGAVQEVAWPSFDGVEIEGLLILPVGYEPGRRYPTLVEIHGGPTSYWGHGLFFNYCCARWGHFMAQRGCAVLLPNPRGSAGRGSAFQSAIVGCYGGPDASDLLAGVDHLVQLGIADPDQLLVAGYSGGGYLTNCLIARTHRFRAAVSGAGISNWTSFQGTSELRPLFDKYVGKLEDDPEHLWACSPLRASAAIETPTLFLVGGCDTRTPPAQSWELYEALKARNIETELVVYRGEPHEFVGRENRIDLLRRSVDWLCRHLESPTPALSQPSLDAVRAAP